MLKLSAMEIIAFETSAYKSIMDTLEEIKKNSIKGHSSPGVEWLDGKEVCKKLGVTTRTLQNYRDRGTIPYSQFGSKIYYKSSDINAHLEKYYIKGSS
jgi:excisionase family DNA binding protein